MDMFCVNPNGGWERHLNLKTLDEVELGDLHIRQVQRPSRLGGHQPFSDSIRYRVVLVGSILD